MRKARRDTDKNDYYVPSNAKISITLKHLKELHWIEKQKVVYQMGY